jgi:transglutaminase-like putative cysteine protease
MMRLLSFGSLFLFGLALAARALAAESAADMPPVRRVNIRFVCEIPNPPDGAKSIDIWAPVPTDDERQTIRLLNESELGAGRFTNDKKFNNRIYYRRFEAPFDGTPIQVVLAYDAEVREATVPAAKKLISTRQVTADEKLAPYLGPTRMIPIRGKISALAGDIKMPAGEPLRAGRAIYDYLIDTMQYNYKAPGAGGGDAAWACDSKTGDCTDFHSVFIGACRWRGIPADHVFGMPMPPDKPEGDIRYCHCWARFWVADVGWIPIDASRADKYPQDREYYFGTLGSTWLTLAHGRDVVLEPPQQGPPLNMFHGPEAEVDGKRFEGLRWHAHYRDLPATAGK